MGTIPKLSPRYCCPFTILKQIDNVAYKLDLPEHSKVHPVFHVRRVRKQLGDNASTMDANVLIDYIEASVLPHKLKRILDFQEKCTRHVIRCQGLVEWKDRTEEGSTWEDVMPLKTHFPMFVFEDDHSSKRGEEC